MDILDSSDVFLFLFEDSGLACTLHGLHHGHRTLDPSDVSLFLLEDNEFTPHHGHPRPV